MDTKASPGLGGQFSRFKTFIITDLDGTLLGCEGAEKAFAAWLVWRRDWVGFGVATGRDLDSACGILRERNLPEPDVYLTSLGTEIYYPAVCNGEDFCPGTLVCDQDYAGLLGKFWEPEKASKILDSFDFLRRQEDYRIFKLSYFVDSWTDGKIRSVCNALDSENLKYCLSSVNNYYLDILPEGSSKLGGVKYFCKRWGIPEEKVVVAGDSGNDRDMLRGLPRAVAVANRSAELDGLPGVYYSSSPFAEGILDGLSHFGID